MKKNGRILTCSLVFFLENIKHTMQKTKNRVEVAIDVQGFVPANLPVCLSWCHKGRVLFLQICRCSRLAVSASWVHITSHPHQCPSWGLAFRLQRGPSRPAPRSTPFSLRNSFCPSHPGIHRAPGATATGGAG